MVWTLRFYDENGVEIGYVDKPDKTTYNVAITHPDSKFDELGTYLRSKKRVSVPINNDDLESSEWTVQPGPSTVQLGPKEHLEIVREQTVFDGIDSTTLQDE